MGEKIAAVPASEREALKVIRELEKLGEVKAEAVGRELGFSAEYATILCRSLWKSGYIRGTTITGYEITEKGEKLLLESEKS